MSRKNKLRELTIKNNFMFGAVMSKPAIGKRARYYHSQIDMELLASGEDYKNLPDSYVIFVCDYDPFGEKKYCYTFANQCLEDLELNQQDGCRTIFLSTRGENEEDVPKGVVNFLKFVKADLTESERDFGDDFVKRLQETVRQVKVSREMEERFMSFSLLFKEACEEACEEAREEGRAKGMEEGRAKGMAEGKAEGREEGLLLGKIQEILEFLEELGAVPDEVREKILAETNTEKLHKWLKQAARAESIEEFLSNM